MDIGIFGAGNIGGTLGHLLVAAGHRVRFGLRNPAAANALVAEMGASTAAGTPEFALGSAEAVIFAGPFSAWPDFALAQGPLLMGKVVIDAANPYAQRDGAMAEALIASGTPSGVFVAKLLPQAHVAKAVNTVYWVDLRDKAHRAGERLGMLFAADDETAISTTQTLARDAGFDPVHLGTLARGAMLDPGSAIYAKSDTAAEIRAAIPAPRIAEE